MLQRDVCDATLQQCDAGDVTRVDVAGGLSCNLAKLCELSGKSWQHHRATSAHCDRHVRPVRSDRSCRAHEYFPIALVDVVSRILRTAGC